MTTGQLKHQQETEKAHAAGFKNAWAMRKAMRQATFVPIQPKRKGLGFDQPPSMPIGEPRTRFDRLAGHDGPVNHLMKEGKWLPR